MWALDWVESFKRSSRTPSFQLFFVCLGFLGGIVGGSWLDLALPPVLFLLFGFIVLVTALFVDRGDFRLLFLFFCAIFFAWSRIAQVDADDRARLASILPLIGEEVRLRGLVVNDPIESGSFQTVILEETIVQTTPFIGRVRLAAPRFPSLDYGNRLSATCRLSLWREKIVSCLTYNQPIQLSQGGGMAWRRGLYRLKDFFRIGLERALPEPHAGLAKGLLFGEPTFSDQTELLFQRTGLSHLTAASGYNVVILMRVFLAFMILFLPRPRAFVFILAAIVFYVFLAGADPPVIRAGLMAAAALIGRHTGRLANSRNVLLLTAIVMLIFQPALLRDDIGFELSFLATGGILWWAEAISRRSIFLPKVGGLREAWSTSLSAVVATTPLILWRFGTVSLTSPLANLLIIPLVPYAMATSAVAGFIGILAEVPARLAGVLAWTVLELILRLVEAFSALPFAVFNIL